MRGVGSENPGHQGIAGLLVGERPANYEAVSASLTSLGVRLHIAASATDAFDTLRTCDVAVVLADLLVDGVDAFTFVELVRSGPSAISPPVFLMTAKKPDEVQATKAYAAGV